MLVATLGSAVIAGTSVWKTLLHVSTLDVQVFQTSSTTSVLPFGGARSKHPKRHVVPKVKPHKSLL